MLTKLRPLNLLYRLSSVRNAVNLREVLANLVPELKPPVANKLLFADGLKFMIVGGPNIRDDFHVEMGEELFYQIKGDMELKVVLPGTKTPSTIVIKEGHVFRLPGGIPHSPQRFADTVGIVLERKRSQYELDCMRWYSKPDSTQIVYEEYFHCYDLGSQIKEAIERYQASKARNSFPTIDAQDLRRKNMNNIFEEIATAEAITAPIDLATILTKSSENNIYKGEFVVDIYRGREIHQLTFPKWLKEICLYQFRGESEVFSSRSRKPLHTLNNNDVHILHYPDDAEAVISLEGISVDSVVIAVKNVAEEPIPSPGSTS